MTRPNFKANQPSVLDLFAGAGGFSLGFHWAGFRTAVAVDHNPIAVETLQANFGHLGTKTFLHDLAKMTPLDFSKNLRKQGIMDDFDVVVGGPPCQGWSRVGRAKLKSLRSLAGHHELATDPRNDLYRSFLGFIARFQPKVALMENVPGMLSHGGINMAEQIACDMAARNFEVTWSLLNAEHFGVPQNRERLFFVGVRKDLGIKFKFPEYRSKTGERVFPSVSVQAAVGDLPRIPNGSRQWVLPYTEQAAQSDYARLMRCNADPSTVFDHVCRTHNAQDLEAFALMKQGGKYIDLPKRYKRYRDDIFDDKYRKLYWKRPSWCLTAHLSRDCYSHIHPIQHRTISVREAARLQSFPDWFYLGGNLGEKFQLIGNAVPPILARELATAVRNQVFSTARPSVRPSRQLNKKSKYEGDRSNT